MYIFPKRNMTLPNKRNAVYDFFAEVFKLDKKMLDESKVTIEPESAMYSFGEKGALLLKAPSVLLTR